ncbi:MAG TPA: hypothetical protein VK735_24055 [Pseudonocardia sp.]|jgi:hypothetical protein|uniref:hypothetical protein n=1 Tax=Pseudonocardia sp. TaxID=60912 RepID=UPI002B76064F|nr:hypothetical protein [Pseudonocardia sp.]HTF50526.1 hypothetical protein [Pseudonocardia sp.]
MPASTPVEAASNGYPPGVARPLFVSEHGDYAAVLLETGSTGHPYPYFVLTRRQGGQWEEHGSSNMSGGWYQTEDDNGVVVFWGETAGLDEPLEVEFKGRRWPAEVKAGVFFTVWWDELDPGNLLEPTWPAVSKAR